MPLRSAIFCFHEVDLRHHGHAAGDVRLMATLYHVPTSRSLRVLWTLGEIGVTVNVRSLGVRPRLQEPEYLTINPAGTLPALIDGNRAIYENRWRSASTSQPGTVPTWSWRRTSRNGRSSCNGCCMARRPCRRRSPRWRASAAFGTGRRRCKPASMPCWLMPATRARYGQSCSNGKGNSLANVLTF